MCLCPFSLLYNDRSPPVCSLVDRPVPVTPTVPATVPAPTVPVLKENDVAEGPRREYHSGR